MGRRFAISQTTLLCDLTSAFIVMGAAPSHAEDQRPHLVVTYGATTLTLYPSADAFINQYQPTRNYGSSSVLKTRNEFGAGGGSGWAGGVRQAWNRLRDYRPNMPRLRLVCTGRSESQIPKSALLNDRPHAIVAV